MKLGNHNILNHIHSSPIVGQFSLIPEQMSLMSQLFVVNHTHKM